MHRIHQPVRQLSARELEVLRLVADGLSNAAICARLFVSPKTLERHISTIFLKLGLSPNEHENRRVLAVLHYLESVRPALAS